MKVKKDFLTYIVFICLLILIASGSNTVASQSHFSEIDDIISQQKDRHFNGVILIAKDEEILFEKAYGFANREEQTLLDTQNQFLIASLSKQITATLILLQVDAGRIKLTAPIKTYLPDLPTEWNEVTAHHLLNHTSGIKEMGQPLDFEPGTKFSYSNEGYDLLGDILEKVVGETFAVLLSNLFRACGMDDTVSPSTGGRGALYRLYKNLAAGYTECDNQTQPAIFERDVKSNP